MFTMFVPVESARRALHDATRELLLPLSEAERVEALARWREAHRDFLAALKAPRGATITGLPVTAIQREAQAEARRQVRGGALREAA
jgi:hypothetical protein